MWLSRERWTCIAYFVLDACHRMSRSCACSAHKNDDGSLLLCCRMQMIFSASVISLLFMLILLTCWMFILKKSVPMISRFTCSHRVYMNLAIIEVWWCTYPSILKEKTHDICCFYKLRPLCKIIPVHLLGFILYNCTKQMLNILHRWFTFYILYTSFKNLVNLVFFAHFNIYHLSAVSICISLFVIVYALKTILVCPTSCWQVFCCSVKKWQQLLA